MRAGRCARRAYRSAQAPFFRCPECGTLFDPEPLSADRLRDLYEGPGYFGAGDPREDRPFCGYPGDYLANQVNVERKFDQVLGHLERYVGPAAWSTSAPARVSFSRSRSAGAGMRAAST